ncbi:MULTISPECIES: MFS transporter [unclassified Mesorhizobium]|uniref:MFS transporter n=1 Tax=unclassified Mesorhizobium TaxID=325217 RepID=UPI00112E7325|nr:MULTISPECIES: MFS transporter [unclassified Mesorhizobium]MBZ9894354.1 hypothetical protein [Mesorhizobium sp. BR1-1-6]TPM57687.1 MFS transporter [Mesorhizobium sp. B2-2-4]TPM65510.1 MFS transporter [Mesorhizobium sp. B2-2-1]TPM98485.1 MFS transporter [Mesorhizobium sp. B2-1-5]TPN38580.1 MFS transporter [Mesorhizobium sp. B1-1-6]
MSASDPTLASAEAASTKASFLTLFPSIMLPMFLAVIDQTIVAAALPIIAGDLHSVERTAGVVVAYQPPRLAPPLWQRSRRLDSCGNGNRY